MQNTETMTPDAQPIPTSPVEIPTPQKHNKINILVLSIIFLLLGSTSFFAYQYIQLKQQVNSKPTNTMLETLTFSSANTYTCPPGEWVNCMPGPNVGERTECTLEYLNWAKTNCPNFKGAAM